MTTPSTITEYQAAGAAAHDAGGAITLIGDPGSAERIMFVHGSLRGDTTCGCPVLDEDGNNVNPNRVPLQAENENRPSLPNPSLPDYGNCGRGKSNTCGW